MESEARHQWISVAAYYEAEHRGFAPMHELDDWLTAEKDYFKIMIASYLAIAEEDGGISIIGLTKLASAIGMENLDHLDSEAALIHAIQKASQGYACFQDDSSDLCNESAACQWNKACRQMTAVWNRKSSSRLLASNGEEN